MIYEDIFIHVPLVDRADYYLRNFLSSKDNLLYWKRVDEHKQGSNESEKQLLTEKLTHGLYEDIFLLSLSILRYKRMLGFLLITFPEPKIYDL